MPKRTARKIFVLLADRDVPDLHIRAGDHVVAHPGGAIPCAKCEAMQPNFGRLLLEVENGALRLIGPRRELSDFASAVGLAPQALPGRYRRSVLAPETRHYRRNADGNLLDQRQVRRSRPPAGLCGRCWWERRPACPGRFYVVGFPSTRRDRPSSCWCDECVERARALGIHLIPAGRRPSPDHLGA